MMMMMKSVTAVMALLCASGASAFAPTIAGSNAAASATALHMASFEDAAKTAAASVLAATLVLGAAVEPAQALGEEFGDFGSSQVIAARSGGRAGGRSAASRSAPSARSVNPSRPSTNTNTRTTTVINRTYVTPAAPVYSSPSVIVAPPVYNPMPGLGLSLGLNAVNQIGNDMRDYRQEREIQDTRSELQASKMREAEMEARLRQLENGQGQMNQAQQLQFQQQMMLQQQAAANAAAAAAAAK
eukprot:CAMPEP_0172367138 /NCGR_PEP_ID=MMETSP1060-20121228/19402_1 /TAXON_ID=37318 /ORGANISM="Pseudo-nitzschia pungens, Strain cf. cingulata" /LENGTH=242 /DNA_ID=CAMNT_0013091269 /DNA_START=330 /DNA_END=1058 /DNA_ORIENTATION=+